MELASRQTRLALGFLAVSAPVTEVVSRVQWSNSPLPYERPPEYTFVLAWLLDAQAWAGSLIAVGVLLAMGFGIGRFHFRARLGQVVGYGIGAHVVVATGVGWLVAMLFEPQSTSTGAGRRCVDGLVLGAGGVLGLAGVALSSDGGSRRRLAT